MNPDCEMSGGGGDKKKCDACGKQECADLILQSCSGCYTVSYCDTTCQRAGWQGHKAVCIEIRAGNESTQVQKSGCFPRASVLNLSTVESQLWDIFRACCEGRHEKLQIMLRQQSGIDINWTEPIDGATAVYVASEHGHDKCLQVLIRFGADLSKVNKDGYGPIHVASKMVTSPA